MTSHLQLQKVSCLPLPSPGAAQARLTVSGDLLTWSVGGRKGQNDAGASANQADSSPDAATPCQQLCPPTCKDGELPPLMVVYRLENALPLRKYFLE